MVTFGRRPCPRAAFGYSQSGKSAFLFGGRCSPGRTNDLFHFDLLSYTWTEIKTSGAIPRERSWMTLTNGNSTMLLYGGLDGADQTVTDIWIFEPDPIIRDLARNVQTGPYSKEERVLTVPNLWKKWNSDFTTRSWRLCPEVILGHYQNRDQRARLSCNQMFLSRNTAACGTRRATTSTAASL